MHFAQETDARAHVIRSYAPGEIVVALPVTPEEILAARQNQREIQLKTRSVTDHVVITPDTLVDDWSPRSVNELGQRDIDLFLRLQPEVVLLGTGAALLRPPPRLERALNSEGVGLEVMDTASACRTFNILTFEGRRVVLAMFMIEPEN